MIENKQYILIRTDKKFPIGKIMAHIGHNCIEILVHHDASRIVHIWLHDHDQTKIVLDGGSEEDIEKIIKKSKRLEVPTSFIEDVHIKERIVAVVGPIEEKKAKYLGLDKLRLYNV